MTDVSVKVCGENIAYFDEIESLLQKYAQKRKCRVVASNPHGSPRRPYSGTEFDLCIYFWSVPTEMGGTKIGSVYGYKLYGGQKDSYQLGRGMNGVGWWNIIFDTDGQEVAIVVDKTLYVMFDLPHDSGRVESETVGKILDLILADYFMLVDDREQFGKVMTSRQVDGNIKKFRQFYINSRDQDTVSADKRKILQDQVDQDKVLFLDAVRQWRSLFQDEVRKAPCDEEIETIFERLCSLSSTGKIEVLAQSIIFPIGQVDIYFGGDWYDIGQLVIAIDMFEKNVDEAVRCYNITRTESDGNAHPHVSSDGSVCLGNLSDACDEMYRNGEVYLLVLVLRDFFKTYNSDNAYVRISSWPRKSGC